MLIDASLLYIIFTEYEGETWKTDLLAKMMKFNPKERPSFSTVVEVLENYLETPTSWSSFPPVSGKLFSISQ
jgi:hypothetical protein